MKRNIFIAAVLVLLMAIPASAARFEQLSIGELTITGTASAEQVTSTDDATITDDLAVGGDATVTGTVSGEQITSTDDATVADDLGVGGDLDVTGTIQAGSGNHDLTNSTGLIDGEKIQDDTIDDDSIDFTDVTISDFTDDTTGAGAVASLTDLSLVETGSPEVHKTVFTFATANLSLTDEAGTIAYVGQKIYDFPEGAILVLGATSDVDLTLSAAGVNADWDGDFGLGTATAGNDADLTSTEDDILPKTATPQAVASVTTANGQSTSAENVVFDGTATAKDLYLNFLVDDADHDVTSTPTDLLVDGTITILWVNLGDY